MDVQGNQSSLTLTLGQSDSSGNTGASIVGPLAPRIPDLNLMGGPAHLLIEQEPDVLAAVAPPPLRSKIM